MAKDAVIVVSIVAYAAASYLLTEVFRRYRRIGAAFIVLSLCTFPLWAAHRDSWFEWVKIFSVLVPMLLVSAARIAEFEDKRGGVWDLLRKPWALWVLFCVLALNIAEASVRDWQLGNLLNALAGLVLIVTIPVVTKYWRFEKKCCGDLIVDFPLGWCFLYTTWNAAFLYGSIPDEFAGGLAILIACELYSVFGRHDLYIMGRIYTLAIFVVQLAVFDVLPWMDSSHWFNQGAARGWGGVNLAVAAVYLFWYFRQLVGGKAETAFRHPASAPEGVFPPEAERKALSGFASRFYFHRSME